MTKYAEIITEIATSVQQDAISEIFRDDLTITVSPENINSLLLKLRDNPDTSFDQLLDVTAIDRLKGKHRFEVVYFLWSNKFKNRVRLKVLLEGEAPECPSVTGVFESANWYERETFDMYGVKFTGHPNLRRFYMPEDYADPLTGEPIYPLRKDFPLAGIPDSLPLPPYPEKLGDIV